MSTTEGEVSAKPFETLSDTQQAIITELAREDVDDLDRAYADIISDCVDSHGVDSFDGSYISQTKSQYPELISERKNALLNDHLVTETPGGVRVEGSIDLKDTAQFPSPQTFDERPVKQSSENGTEDSEPGETYTLEVDKDTLWRLVSDRLTPDDRREIFEEVAR